MRVLIVSPDDGGLDSIPEVRFVQSIHHTSLLHGSTLTEMDIFAACRETAFDIIHFASHGGPDGIRLSGGAVMGADAIATAARLRETKGLIFNSCESAVLANYAVRHGVQWALSADDDLRDQNAWKLPAAFYGALRNGHAKDFVGAFILADGGDGMYGLRVSPMWLQELQRSATMAATIPHAALAFSRTEALRWAAVIVVLNVILSALITWLGGG